MTATARSRTPLYRDVRVLQWAFQLAVVAVVVGFLVWIYGNYTDSTSQQNIPTTFDFLDNPATFQITGSPLSPNAPIRDALVVGVLNTLRVSVAGIVLATVLGTVIGIGRLSHNWVVNKLAAAYVEAVRNIPLYLFLIMGFLAIVLGVFPAITNAWEPLGVMIISNRGIAGPWFEGSALLLCGIALLAALAATVVAKWRASVSAQSGTPARTGAWALGTFAVVLAGGWVLGGFAFTIPELDGRRTSGGIRIDPSYFALLFALVVYTASHIAEIVRGSIQAVPRGQGEASDALGLSGFQRLWYVVLPQAFRIAVPPIGNQYLNLIKNSSLGAAIGYYDLTLVTRTAVGNGAPAVPAFALTMAIYIVISLVTSLFVNLVNRRLALVER
jgi:general L-amino acid transport system permease protein